MLSRVAALPILLAALAFALAACGDESPTPVSAPTQASVSVTPPVLTSGPSHLTEEIPPAPQGSSVDP